MLSRNEPSGFTHLPESFHESDDNRSSYQGYRHVNQEEDRSKGTQLAINDGSHDLAHPEWKNPVRWCAYANAVVMLINVIFMITALVISASQRGGLSYGSLVLYHGSCSTTKDLKIGLHLLINILSVTLTATSSYCSNILTAVSREDINKAHSQRVWLPIGTTNLQNFSIISRTRCIL